MVHQISVRIADVHDELRRVLTHLNEFPSPEDVKEVHGPSNTSVRRFYTQLRVTAREAAGATTLVMEELTQLDSAIRAALEDLTNHDADLAQSADKVEAFLDSANPQPAPEQTPPSGNKDGGSYMGGPKA